MVDRVEWLRLYVQFLEVEETLHQDRTAALIEVMRQRWVRFQEFAES